MARSRVLCVEMPGERAIAEGADERSRIGATPAEIDPLLATFVVEHNDRLIRLAYLVCGSPTDAADAVQRGFEQAWRQRSSLRDQSRLRAWLDRVVVREAIRLGRRPWYRHLLSLDTRVGWIDPPARGVEPEQWLALRQSFDRLPAEQRAVLALHLHAGYSVSETAALVGAPVETVRSRLRLAKDRLRRELSEPDR